MRIAVISDIHGNMPAFERVLADAKANGAERYVFLGDYIFDLPYSEEVVETLMSLEHADCIAGNKEMYFRKLAFEDPAKARFQQIGILFQTQRTLSVRAKNFLNALPEKTVIELEFGHTLYAAHTLPNMRKLGRTPCNSSAAFSKAMFGAPFTHDAYLMSLNAFYVNEMAPELNAIDTSIVAYGHNHLQGYGRCRDQLIVNPGSCGRPLDFDTRAAYTILDETASGLIVFERRVAYDVEATIAYAKASECYRVGRIWSELGFFSLRTGVDMIADFFVTAKRIAERKGECGDVFENETVEDAYRELQNQMREIEAVCRKQHSTESA